MSSPRSNSVTLCPRCAAVSAACSPAGPAPDHGDLEGLVRLDAQRVLPFIARARIDGAGDVEQLAGVPGAAFVAAEADPYGIQTVFGILVDQFRLGDEGAPESDHVGLAVADDLIRNGRMHIPPDGNDRNAGSGRPL